MKHLFTCILCVLFFLSAHAQQGDGFKIFDQEVPKKSQKEFQYIAFFFNQGVTGNYFPRSDFLRGQVFGRLYGGNTTSTSDSLTTSFFEQRLLPFFIYQPKLFNGRAILRASFEIDWTWGDVSYTAGGNFGSALSSDVVNLQTQNVELELIPANGWAINLGLQRLFDTPYNPYRTLFDRMTNSAYRLMYWGTDGVGVSLRHDGDLNRFKAGYYQLYENNIQENDDVTLHEFTYERNLTHKLRIGGSAYYVRDRANGEGGPSILGQGLNATLNAYNGTFRFPFGGSAYQADVFWLGTFWGYNQDYMLDRFFMTGFVNVNAGSARTLVENTVDEYEKAADILGVGANLRLGYRYGQTENDMVNADVFFSTGDGDGLDDGTYSGVMTGNTWGAPAAIPISHGAYILMPHGNVVNRFVSVVGDFSNMGYGLTAVMLNAQRDLIPYKLNAKVGGAFGMANEAPAGGGNIIGTEVNGRLNYTLGVFMNLEVHGAYLFQGDFMDSRLVNGDAAERPVNPWTVFVVYKWLMF